MDYKVFYRKYRPVNFNQLVGQEYTKEILVNSIKNKKIAHSYIFTGPRGTGKTSTAKIFAKTLNCTNNVNGISCEECEMCKTYNESADIIEIDAASNNGVEEIRSLRDSVKIAPYNSKYKIYIIDEVHMLSNSAWNAFLKTLEEPPSHVIFILATTEINKIPDTVKSRCQRFDFTRISEESMFNHLSSICREENMDIEEKALYELIKLSNGCLRDSLSFLDKLSKFDTKITPEIVEKNLGFLTENILEDLLSVIKENNKNSIIEIIDKINSIGITPLNFINDFIEYLLKIVIKNHNIDENMSIKKIIFKLNKIILNFNSVVNPYILIKLELITENYFPGNNFVDISQKEDEIKAEISIETDQEKNHVKKCKSNYLKNNIDIIKNIRINNCFVDASKNLKNNFIEKWNKLINYLNEENDFTILGLVENSSINVVSKSNVLFSFKKDNEVILFNNNLDVIEKKFNDKFNEQIKFIAVSDEEWNVEKNNFINKTKEYNYIDENLNSDVEEDIKTKNLAENIFGDDIIEVR